MTRPTPEITVAEFAGERENGIAVDVREPAEYAQGHVPGAVSIPTGRLPSRLVELDRGVRVHVICASGNRSRAMTDLLLASGFDAVSVAGGTRGWLASGREVVVGQ